MLALPRSASALATALALAGAALTGCGSDDEPAGRTATVPADEPVVVIGTEYAFDPEDVVVEGAGPVEIELENRGALAHNLTVFEGDEEVGATPTFQGGETDGATIDLEPGTYAMVCTVGNHAELGMVGELEVR